MSESLPDRRSFLRSALAAAGLIVGNRGPALEGARTSSLDDVITTVTQPQAFRGARPGDPRAIDGLPFCWCPPGRFRMGSPPQEVGHRPDEAQVDVVLTRGFWIAKTEVTQGQWGRIVGAFPDRPPTSEFGMGDDVPVYWINFIEAETFCRRLNERARRAGTLPAGWDCRLPTEAQWEYACRAGTATATSFGSSLGRDQANFNGEQTGDAPVGSARGRATPAGAYPANAWGVHDMHGNIFEWCRDWYHAQLPGGTDPDVYATRGVPNRDGTYSRVRRGGAWNDAGEFCRSAMRLRYEPERRSDHIGFRVVLVET